MRLRIDHDYVPKSGGSDAAADALAAASDRHWAAGISGRLGLVTLAKLQRAVE